MRQVRTKGLQGNTLYMQELKQKVFGGILGGRSIRGAVYLGPLDRCNHKLYADLHVTLDRSMQ